VRALRAVSVGGGLAMSPSMEVAAPRSHSAHACSRSGWSPAADGHQDRRHQSQIAAFPATAASIANVAAEYAIDFSAEVAGRLGNFVGRGWQDAALHICPFDDDGDDNLQRARHRIPDTRELRLRVQHDKDSYAVTNCGCAIPSAPQMFTETCGATCHATCHVESVGRRCRQGAEDDRRLFGNGVPERRDELLATLFGLLGGAGPTTQGTLHRPLLRKLATCAANAVIPSDARRQNTEVVLPPANGQRVTFLEFRAYLQELLASLTGDKLAQELVLRQLIAEVQSGHFDACYLPRHST